MYPNPVKEVLHIKLNTGLTLKQVNFYNIQSQYLYTVQSTQINVSHLPTGIYFLEVETSGGKPTKKIVVE